MSIEVERRLPNRKLAGDFQQLIKMIARFLNTETHLVKSSRRSLERIIKGTSGDYFYQSSTNRLTVFIHGLMHNETAFHRYDPLLKSKSSILRVNISNSFQDIEKSAREVIGKIKRYSEGSVDVHLVGHSLGGLIAAAIAESGDFPVKNVVAIGSPFHGTSIAKFFTFGKAVQQMKPGSPFLKSLVESMKSFKEVNYHFAGSESDPVIDPLTSSFPFEDHFIYQKKFEGIGHGDLLYNEEMEKWVMQSLGILDV